MAKGYLVANVEVLDHAAYEEYRRRIGPVLEKFGARPVIRGGTVERLEHAEGFHRVVVLEFESLARAHEFYHSADYAPLIALRQKATRSQVLLVDGI